MPIDKFDNDHIWANDGITTEPSDVKKDLGWVAGEQVSADYLNHFQAQAELKINSIVDERLISYPETLTDPYTVLATGLWTSGQYGNSLDNLGSLSHIVGGTTKAYCDIAICFDENNVPMVLAADRTANTIEKWNARTLTSVDTSGTLTNNLPAGLPWIIQSICTDNVYVYVMFYNTTSDIGQIQSWKISDWSVNSGWAATGTALPGSAHITSVKKGKIICASATKLATINGWNTIASAASAAISVITKSTGAIVASGAGDAPASTDPKDEIVSDGTNLFFYSEGGGNYRICTATIANPQVGSGGTGYPLQHSLGSNKCALGIAGGLVVSASCAASYIAGDFAIQTHRSDYATCDEIYVGQDSQATPLPGDDFIFDKAYDICYDGVNVWLLTRTLGQQAGAALIKIDAAKFYADNAALGVSRQVSDLTSSRFLMAQEYALSSSSSDLISLKFDGRDLWANVNPDAGGTSSGKIYRFPLALLRN